MPDLSSQLREYFDATAPPQDLDTIITDQVWVDSKSQTRRRGRMVPAWAYGLGALVLVLVVALGLNLLLAGDQSEVVEPTPTTVAPDVETMTDLEVIEAGVDAIYSGDAERAVELFELDMFGPSDDWIRREAAYQAVLNGKTTVECQERDTPGVFTCTWSYHNAIGDAIGYVESSRDIVRVDVEDGLIVQFGQFPFKDFGEDPLLGSLETFLNQVAESGDQDGSTCEFRWPYGGSRDGDQDRLTPDCVDYVIEHLDDWAAANSE